MFEDRKSAGILLARKLKNFVQDNNVLVLALARGGVAVGKAVSEVLKVSFDALIVKKIGSPQNPELAIGGVGPKNTVFWNEYFLKTLKISEEEKDELLVLKMAERNAQENLIRGDKPLEISGKTVILVDDGVATGASVMTAQKFIKKEGAGKIILATPVVADDTLKYIKRYFDMVIYLKKVKEFYAVGEFYKDFPQVENEEVIKLLQ